MGKKTRKRKKKKTKSRKRRKPKKKRKSKRTKKRKLPANPTKGQLASLTRKGRKITFKATGLKGFGKWRIISNTKA